MRICPFCSTENEAFFRFCLGCGADLDEELGPAVEEALAPAEPEVRAARPPTSDTVTDMKPITPEMLAEVERARAEAENLRQLPTPREPRPADVGSARVSGGVAASPFKSVPRVSEAVSAPSAPSGTAARPAADRQKTLEPGKAAKSASPAAQALGQAQLDLARRQGADKGGRADKAAAGDKADRVDRVEGPTQRAKGSPEVAAPVAKAERKGIETPRKPGESTTQPRPVEGRYSTQPDSRQVVRPGSGARLVVILEDGTDGSVLELGPETTVIGREGADINFPHDDFLARHHAELYFEAGSLHLRPLESTNGVFVQVHHEVELKSGDVFRIGQQLLSFEVLAKVTSELVEEPRGHAIPLGSPIPEGAWGRLGQLIAPETMGSVYLLGGSEVYLGRERGDITFPGDGFVSGLHAQISQRDGRCYLKDLGSSNGTYLRLTEPAPVKRGTLVLAGQQLFRVES